MSHQGDSGTIWPYYTEVLNRLGGCTRLANIGSGHHFAFEGLVKEQFPHIHVQSFDRGMPEQLPTVCHYQELDIENAAALSQTENSTFDVVTIFEVLEHIDDTDQCLELAHHLLRSGGELIVASPNLASIYGRIELALGYQPHVLEVSNRRGPLGMGLFGKMNYSHEGEPIHHLRGITLRALRELIELHNFEITRTYGYLSGVPFWPKSLFSGLGSSVLVIAKPRP